MAEYIFKVQISLGGNNSECFYHRQVIDSTESNFNVFRRNLVARYEILKSIPFKITWCDNIGDQISIFNETDYSIFMELKGTKVIIENDNISIAGERKSPETVSNPIAAERKTSEADNNSIAVEINTSKTDKNPIAAERKITVTEDNSIAVERKKKQNDNSSIRTRSSFNGNNKVNAKTVGNKSDQLELYEHPHVWCDGCNRKIRGYRYKCLHCPDFDLCSACEMDQIHSCHNMVRIVKQMPRVNLNNDLQKAKLIAVTESEARQRTIRKRFSAQQPRAWITKVDSASDRKEQASTSQVKSTVPFYKKPSSVADVTETSNVSSSSVSVAVSVHSSDRKEGNQISSAVELGNIVVEKDKRQGFVAQEQEDQIPLSPVKATAISKRVSFVDESVSLPVDSSDPVEANQISNAVELGNIVVDKDKIQGSVAQDQEDQMPLSPVKMTAITKRVSFVDESVSFPVDLSDMELEVEQVSRAEDRASPIPILPVEVSPVKVTAVNKRVTFMDELVETPAACSSTIPVLTSVDSTSDAEEPKSTLVEKDLDCSLSSTLRDFVMTRSEDTNKIHSKPLTIDAPECTSNHRDEKINLAISKMTAMGFSNDRGWLTCLLEGVNGNVIEALDLLYPTK